VVRINGAEPFIVADIPGLIKGAHQGTGLGTKFLRHIERTRILVHLIDVSAIDPDDPLSGYDTINHELAMHNEKLAQKPQIVVLNKMDLPGARQRAEIFQSALKMKKTILISALTGQGLAELTTQIVRRLDRDDE
jgi:GTP-binding protein